jgi:hypothetical protein
MDLVNNRDLESVSARWVVHRYYPEQKDARGIERKIQKECGQRTNEYNKLSPGLVMVKRGQRRGHAWTGELGVGGTKGANVNRKSSKCDLKRQHQLRE